jgi:cell division septum initiation protein DivIVA
MFGGYDRTEVERFLAQVVRSIDEYVNRIDQLGRQVAQLEADLQRYRDNEDLLRSSVVHAQRGADELLAAARTRAETIKGEAELEAKRISQSLADMRNEREQFEYAFHGLLTGFLRRLEHGNPALSAQGHAMQSSSAGSVNLQAERVISQLSWEGDTEADPSHVSLALEQQRDLAQPAADTVNLSSDSSLESDEAAPNPDRDAADFEAALKKV